MGQVIKNHSIILISLLFFCSCYKDYQKEFREEYKVVEIAEFKFVTDQWNDWNAGYDLVYDKEQLDSLAIHFAVKVLDSLNMDYYFSKDGFLYFDLYDIHSDGGMFVISGAIKDKIHYYLKENEVSPELRKKWEEKLRRKD